MLIGGLALVLATSTAPLAQGTGVTFVEAIQDDPDLSDPIAVAVSPDGAHVYVAATQGTLVAFARDPGTGVLAPVDIERDGVDGVDGLGGAFAMALSPDGAHVYVASITDNAVAVFARDAGTGALDFVAPVQVLDPEAVAVSPDGAHVYVASFSSNTITVYARDPDTGTLELNDFVSDGVAGVDGLEGVSGVTVSPDGRHVYATSFREDGIVTFARDPVFGGLAFVEAKIGLAGVLGGSAVTVSSDGAHVYAAGALGDEVVAFARDAVTGALTEIDTEKDGVQGVDGLEGVRSIALSPDGTLLHAVAEQDDAVTVFARDPGTGELSFIEAEIDGVNGVDGLLLPRANAASPDGLHVYVTGQGRDAVVTFAVDGAVVTTTTTTTSTTTTTLNGCALEPLAGCFSPGSDRSRVSLKDLTSLLLKDQRNDGKDQLVWKWAGLGIDVAQFGDPLTATDYTFCLYDDQGLLLSAAAPAGRLCDGKPCWTARRDGFRYRDRDKGLDGLAEVTLAAEDDGHARITVVGRGPNLGLPSLPLADDTFVAQLVAGNGACFEGQLQAFRNDGKVVEAVFDD
jgi:6-phosphogluconolactonase (cycloisomerase 2 family)